MRYTKDITKYIAIEGRGGSGKTYLSTILGKELGVGVFKNEFDQFSAYKIFVDTPEAIRDERAKGRDVPRDDRTAEDWAEIWRIWTESDKNYYTPELAKKADLIVGSVDGEFDVEGIKKELIKVSSL